MAYGNPEMFDLKALGSVPLMGAALAVGGGVVSGYLEKYFTQWFAGKEDLALLAVALGGIWYLSKQPAGKDYAWAQWLLLGIGVVEGGQFVERSMPTLGVV